MKNTAYIGEIGFLRAQVCASFKVSEVDIVSNRRDRHTVIARHVAMLLAKQLTAASLNQIGRQFGGRDHSTVMNGIRRGRDMVQGDKAMAAEYLAISLRFAVEKKR